MKRMILLSLLVLSMSFSATAIYDPNNTHTSSNNSGPQVLKAQPTTTSAPADYSINFEQEKATCGPQGIDNASISSVNVSPNETTVKVDGVFQTTHPKHNLTSNIEQQDENHYILRIKAVETSKAAQRCFGNIEYSANFTANEGYLLEVYHNQTKMTGKQMPEATLDEGTQPETESEESQGQENPEVEKDQESNGFLDNILKRFGNIF